MSYTLQNGRTIESDEMSAKLEKLLELMPHKSDIYTWDDIGMAALMADLYGEEIRFAPNNGAWYLWHHCWVRQDGMETISDMLQTMLNLIRLYGAEVAALYPQEEEDAGKFVDYVNTLRKHRAMQNILEVLKTCSAIVITGKDMDSNPYVLNTPSGAFDLKTDTRISDEDIRRYCITRKTTCSLPDFTTKTCTRWNSFIDEIMGGDKEKASFLQRALGYSLLGVNREECMFIAYGSKTRNGKGTLFSTIQAVLGREYADTTAPGLICEGKNGKVTDFNAPQPALARMVGTRMVIMSESSKEVRLDAASMKTMTGRDTLMTRDLYEKAFTFIPQFTLWLNTNHLPAVNDDTVFSSGRIYVIEFDVHFDAEHQDKDLKELFSSPGAMPTILAWLYDGCREYLQKGLLPPASVIEATDAYRKLHDRMGSFIEDCCIVDDDMKALRGDIYARYRQWCGRTENKFSPMGSTSFYNEIASRGFPAKRSADGWYLTGIALQQP